MIILIKFTICLLVVYIIYKALLAKENIPVFKRYFLLLGILFSLIVSLIEIKVNVPASNAVHQVIITPYLNEINTDNTKQTVMEQDSFLFLKYFLLVSYTLVVIILLFRYITNIRRLLCSAKVNTVHKFDGYKIAIVNHKINPHSFLNTIYLDEEFYNNGAVRKEILLHELTHIREKHSIDILFIEFLQVIFWFNPLFILFKKEIKLNHEYLADRKAVDSDIETDEYLNFILQVASRKSTSYLGSNLDYSFIKKRFIMLTKKKSSARACIKKILCIPVIMLLATVISFNQRMIAQTQDKNSQTEWWISIMEKHALNMKGAYNSFKDIFITYERVYFDGGISTYFNANLIMKFEEKKVDEHPHFYLQIEKARNFKSIDNDKIKDNNENKYMIAESCTIEHNPEDGTFKVIPAEEKGKIYNQSGEPSLILNGEFSISTKKEQP